MAKKKKKKKFRPMSNKFTEKKTELSEGTLIFGFCCSMKQGISEVSLVMENNLRRFTLRKLGEKTVIKK